MSEMSENLSEPKTWLLGLALLLVAALPASAMAQPSENATFWLSNFVKAMACSPNGKMLASGTLKGKIRLWDAASGNEVATLEGHGHCSRRTAPLRFLVPRGSCQGLLPLAITPPD